MRRILLLALLLLAMLAAGCAPRPLYQPFDGSHGYSEAPIAPDLFEVSFTGTSSTSLTVARYYATLRGAELAAERNRPFIEVLDAVHVTHPRTRVSPQRTTVQTRTWRDRRGRDIHTTTIHSTPGHVHYYEIPFVSLHVRLLEEATETSLEVIELLLHGRRQGASYGPATEALLAVAAGGMR